jgi:hypothetical protein
VTANGSTPPAPAYRLLDAVVSFATLDAVRVGAGAQEATSAPHPHRQPLRNPRRRRAGAVPPRSQHCLTPLERRHAGEHARADRA